MRVFFVSDLHGQFSRYEKLFDLILQQPPDLVLLGGDLLPHGLARQSPDDPGSHRFIDHFLAPRLEDVILKLGSKAPRLLAILGNDDPARDADSLKLLEEQGLLEYIHMKTVAAGDFTITGYSFIPPSPFLLKDWEKYDVSRFVDPGCVPPTEGYRTIPPAYDTEFDTIMADLNAMKQDIDLQQAVFLFHAPPYQTKLDRAGLDGMTFDHVPLDVHVGSIAIQRFIHDHQPYLTLHGHIHESSSLTGAWADRMGNTWMFNAAWEKKDLSVVQFDLEDLKNAVRILL